MKADTIGHVDERDSFRAFVCEKLDLDAGMTPREYARALEQKIEDSPAVEDIPRAGKSPGRKPKYWWRGVPIRHVLSPTQANSVRLRVRQGAELSDAIAWAEGRYGAFDWDGAYRKYQATLQEKSA